MLKAAYPFDEVWEEVFLPGASSTLFVDLLVPRVRLGVEVHGQQHREFIRFFHGDPMAFAAQVRRDRLKAEYLAANDIYLVVLHDDRQDGWSNLLETARGRTCGG